MLLYRLFVSDSGDLDSADSEKVKNAIALLPAHESDDQLAAKSQGMYSTAMRLSQFVCYGHS